MYYSSGNETVDKMGTIGFTGNVIPEPWYRQITRENGKPYLNAIIILADIVYWYRPEVIRDETTGQMTGIRKRFKDDALQRSYKQLSDKFGFSERDAQRAIVHLESMGLIKREFRTISVGKSGVKLNNVLFIHVDVDMIFKITYSVPDDFKHDEPPSDNRGDPCYQEMQHPVTKFGNRGYQECQEGTSKNGNRGYREMREALSGNCNTNTKNTIETTTEITSLDPSDQKVKADKRRKDSEIVVLDPKDRLKRGSISMMQSELEEYGGIPYEWSEDVETMTEAILVLSDWNDYLEMHEGKDWHVSVFKMAEEALVEMATAKDLCEYNGAHVSYAKVIDQINVIYRNHKECTNSFAFFVERIVSRFIEIQEETRIMNQKAYMKSLIWTSFSTYVSDWQSYFHRSYYYDQKR